jgi:hypothetical protein
MSTPFVSTPHHNRFWGSASAAQAPTSEADRQHDKNECPRADLLPVEIPTDEQ